MVHLFSGDMKVFERSDIRTFLWALGIGALISIYSWGVLRQAFLVNLNPHRTDQGAYIAIAGELERTNLTYVTPRVRTPLYMVLGSTVIRATMPIEEAFIVGKIFNIVLSFLVVAGLFLLFMNAISPLFGGALATLATFTVVGYRASYFQCEMLYGFLFLLFFALGFEMFRRPKLITATATGVAGALGHLTKASLILGVWVAMGVALMVAICRCFRLPRRDGCPPCDKWRAALTPPALASVMFAAFFATGALYFLKSKELYGQFFFNFNTAHNIWYDSWDEVKEKTFGVTDLTTLRTMRDYLAEKSPKEILDRFALGFDVFVKSLFVKYSVGSALIVLGIGIVVLALFYQRRSVGDFRPSFYKLVSAEQLFAIVMFGAYLIAYMFHAQVLPFPRFFIALALPAYYWLGLCAKDLFGAPGNSPTAARAWIWLSLLAGAFLVYELRFRWLPLTGREYFGQ